MYGATAQRHLPALYIGQERGTVLSARGKTKSSSKLEDPTKDCARYLRAWCATERSVADSSPKNAPRYCHCVPRENGKEIAETGYVDARKLEYAGYYITMQQPVDCGGT